MRIGGYSCGNLSLLTLFGVELDLSPKRGRTLSLYFKVHNAITVMLLLKVVKNCDGACNTFEGEVMRSDVFSDGPGISKECSVCF